ncbi:MAG: 3-oxoacyl-ACP reductase FabG [Bacteroidales bacterium]|nr:3-oxoacyl-ACP reductase FabG [Candidatus Cacconaster equifaecalis]MBQ0087366.1 3-oxoacyl-ACP reductase FabG [Candidatus Cacconaster scatequi]
MKYALVTGASRGIGRAVSVKLASKGYNILMNYTSNDKAAEEAAELVRQAGGEAELLKFDVSDAAATAEAIKAWQENHPDDYIDVLVNNAGIRRDALLFLMEYKDWRRVLDITLDGFYNVTTAVLQPMLRHKHGRIINMASLSGLKGLPGQTNYSAAKGAIIAATKALAQEIGKKKVTVNAIAPGFVKTDMVEGLDEAALKAQIPMNRFGEPEEIASLVAFLASDEAAYITGECISINGGLYT